MNIVALCFEFLLLIWFWGCIVTYRFGKILLVEGVGAKSAEFGMFTIYSICIVLRIILPGIGNWAMLATLVFWLVIQYFCHWHYTIWGANQQKIDGYNQCFSGSLCIVPRRKDRVIPDFYHIILHLLIALNIILLLFIL